MAFKIERKDGTDIQLTDAECYRVFMAVLTGISSSAIRTYIENTYGAGANFTDDIMDRIGQSVAIGFLDELREGLYIPGETESLIAGVAATSPGGEEGDTV